jgi:phospholipase/carboxylesterase
VAFRAAGNSDIIRLESELARLNSSPTNVHDRKYFTSLYVREPGGILFEFATDGPGFTVDEPAATLGQHLFVPGGDDASADDIKVTLPQFALPGEERVIYRDLPFIHRFYTPEQPDHTVIVLLHGSGGNETDLMAFGRHIAPHATLLGVRGRSYEEGSPRWFKRTAEGGFDQADIIFEAEAFAAFMHGANAAYGMSPERTVFVGYSNGANFLAAFMQLFPGIAKRSTLLRAMPILTTPPDVELAHTKVLLIAGEADPLMPFSPALAEILRKQGAEIEERAVNADHKLVAADHHAIKAWMG